MSIRDFFFGELSKCKGGGVSMQLHTIRDIVQTVNNDFFTQQLNRLLQQHDGRLTLVDGSSYPDFFTLIDNIKREAIGKIEIYARKDVNTNVNATLAVDITLLYGVVTVKPHWCAYKDSRAAEIVSTLLKPLHLKKLQGQTYLRWDVNEFEPLVEDKDYRTELESIFQLSMYPWTKKDEEHYPERMQRYVKDLEIATDVALRLMVASGQQLLDEFDALKYGQ